MNTEAPRVGFDRFIRLEWAAAALQARAGAVSMEDRLAEMLDLALPGQAARRKTWTVLKRLWLEPRPDLIDFSERGALIYREAPDTPASVLTWGMALVAYPFFAKAAEIVGRLTALHGDCTSAEVHRRMAEKFGDGDLTHRATNLVLQTQENWGGFTRTGREHRFVRRSPLALEPTPAAAWLAEACVRGLGRAIPVNRIRSCPLIYPFSLEGSVPYMLSRHGPLEIQADNRVARATG